MPPLYRLLRRAQSEAYPFENQIMKKLIQIYKDGWRVLVRWFWFSLVFAVLQFPFKHIFEYIKDQSQYLDAIYWPYIAILIYIVLIVPILLYFTSEWTGELIAPKINRKKLKEIKIKALRTSRDSNQRADFTANTPISKDK